MLRLGEFLFARPFVTATLVTAELSVTTPTAQTAIDVLVQEGVLRETTGRKRNRVYFAPAIFDAVYAEGTDAEPQRGQERTVQRTEAR